MRWSGVLLMAGWVSGCSLLVEAQFKEPQICEPVTGSCDFGHRCSDAGFCLPDDAGVTILPDGGAGGGGGGGGGGDGGNCQREVCGDTRDNDCDSLVDCADPDCGGLACDDRDACTTGETCSGTTCMRGTAVVCNTPGPCQNPTGTCEAGTGRCLYPAASDGTGCGPPGGRRCCSGTCIDTSASATNCGGCGIACATSQTCQSLEVCSAAEPAGTSGRCTCNTLSAPTCPNSQVCMTGNTCRPTNNAQCAPGQSLVSDGGVLCGAFCRYP